VENFLESRYGESRSVRRLLLVLAGVSGMTGIILVRGTYPGPLVLTVARVLSAVSVGLFLVEQGLAFYQAESFRRYLKSHWPTFVLSVFLLLEIIFILAGGRTFWFSRGMERLAVGSLTRAYVIIIQLYIVAVFAVELPYFHRRFASWRIRPAVAFVFVFVCLIFLGALALILPRATPLESPINFLDALFTSTSAVCITGLAVRDTATEFTVFGQSVILVLIQLGGLGIMSLTAALSLLLGRGIGVRESSLLREVFQVPVMSAVRQMIRNIILMTLGFELLGAILLYRGFTGLIDDPWNRLFAAVFHAVSAFCNAGFSTFSDSLMSSAHSPLVMGTVSGLLVLGGLGFGVIIQVMAWFKGRAMRREPVQARIGLHARVVLAVSAGLLVVGTVTLAALEWNGALAGEPSVAMKLSQAFFQSATCRTAGFNSIDLNLLSPASIFLMVVLMFIGGAPGSTAGGVKVTAVAMVWANMRSIGQGFSRVRLGGREIDQVQIQRSLLVLTAGLIAAAVAVFLLLVTEDRPFLETTFEVFSALGTVGLSLGMTTALSPAGRIIIILCMFIGRLGPLTLASSLTGASREPRVRLPGGQIMIG
jgi:trk system potassium uptake protein